MNTSNLSGIFCHDLPIYKDINGIYCSTTLTDEMFSRYFCIVDTLIVATRVYNLDVTYQEAGQEKINSERIHFIEFPNMNTFHGLFFEIPKAKEILKKAISDVDLIFIKGGVIAHLAASEARRQRRKYQIDAAGCSWDAYWNHSLKGKLVAPVFEFLTKRDIYNAACVVYVTNQWLQKRYPTKGICTNVSNVVINEIDDSVLQKRLLQIKKLKNKNEIILGTTAAIDNKAKGQEYVIKAIKKASKFINIRYELVGGGNPSYLRSIAQKYGVDNSVVFKGQKTHSDVLKWLDEIDIYVQPSLQEGLPRAVIEAMSRACPCIGARTGGIPELIDNRFIFKRKSVNDIVVKLITMLDSDLDSVASTNFALSKQYNAFDLNSRRTEIFEKYKNLVLDEV